MVGHSDACLLSILRPKTFLTSLLASLCLSCLHGWP
jgi:hypothetical protein